MYVCTVCIRVLSNLSIAGLDGLDKHSLFGVDLRGALMLGLGTGL